jgi:hypothetical protein
MLNSDYEILYCRLQYPLTFFQTEKLFNCQSASVLKHKFETSLAINGLNESQ